MSRTISTLYIGIDPGINGGIACIHNNRLITYKNPRDEQRLLDLIRSIAALPTDVRFAVIEQVQGYVGAAHPGSRMFEFGKNYGGLRMALLSCNILFEEVPPRTWQSTLGIPPRRKGSKKSDPKTTVSIETDTQFKNRLKAHAQQLYPDAKITLAISDAILIAHYCKITRE